MECKYCGFDPCVKDGKVRNKQRYKCKKCGVNFVSGDGREKISAESKALAVLLYGRGKAGYGFIAKLPKVSPVSVMKWMKRVADKLPEPDVTTL